jgi:hypothetical protein
MADRREAESPEMPQNSRSEKRGLGRDLRKRDIPRLGRNSRAKRSEAPTLAGGVLGETAGFGTLANVTEVIG